MTTATLISLCGAPVIVAVLSVVLLQDSSVARNWWRWPAH